MHDVGLSKHTHLSEFVASHKEKEVVASHKEKEDMPSIPYSSVVRSLMCIMVCTRPDIVHAVSVVSKFMVNPGKEH